jgi:2-oxoglutarate ferredoxin oxidoreductase subunit beta
MTFLAKPKLHHPTLPKNKLGFTRRDYEGKVSTLCAGCGHDSISAALIQAFWELDVQPHRVAKMSGIGCSSKTPDYFLGQSHGFNTVHGRMPSVLTGANLANRDLIYLGVSGDGDSASIGLGQFAHVMRRGVNMTYILENNGVYGLTKGQFSATADKGSKAKKGAINADAAIDTVSLALLMGATFVARSFSGDKAQLVPLVKAAIAHQGAAFIDVISPCVAFNNHAGSTKSYEYIREHNEAVNRLDFWPTREAITVDYSAGGVIEVPTHDGSILKLRKLHEDYAERQDQRHLHDRQRRRRGEVLTPPLPCARSGPSRPPQHLRRRSTRLAGALPRSAMLGKSTPASGSRSAGCGFESLSRPFQGVTTIAAPSAHVSARRYRFLCRTPSGSPRASRPGPPLRCFGGWRVPAAATGQPFRSSPSLAPRPCS